MKRGKIQAGKGVPRVAGATIGPAQHGQWAVDGGMGRVNGWLGRRVGNGVLRRFTEGRTGVDNVIEGAGRGTRNPLTTYGFFLFFI